MCTNIHKKFLSIGGEIYSDMNKIWRANVCNFVCVTQISIICTCIHMKQLINQLFNTVSQKFSLYEIFAEQKANRIFAIIFLQITGPSWKGSMLCTVTNL